MNYKKVIEDYKSGKIDKEEWMLVIDNDGGYWQYLLECDDETMQSKCDEMEKIYGSPDGYSDVVDILAAAGVNADWC